jgi:hypothetical protein
MKYLRTKLSKLSSSLVIAGIGVLSMQAHSATGSFSAADLALRMEAIPTLQNGRAATEVLFFSPNDYVVLMSDATTARDVISQGRIPVVFSGDFAGIKGNIDTQGRFSIISGLGMPTSSTGFVVNYKASLVNSDGSLTEIASGFEKIQDNAPVLTPISISNTYVVGLSTQTPVGIVVTDQDLNDKATIAVEVKPRNGTVAINGDRAIYTPNLGFIGTDTFSVLAIDRYGAVGFKEITINVVNAVKPFADGVIFEVNPTTVDGHNYAEVLPLGMTEGVQVVHDRAQAAGVVAQGKTPVLIEIGGYPDVIKSVNIDNFATYLFPLGAAKAAGYQFSYKVTALDAAGVNLSTRSGVQVIKDAAPTLTPLTTTAAYIVGGPGTTPQAEFGVTATDKDPNDSVTLTVDTAPINGALDLSKPGKAVYTPKPGFFGADKFIVRATDSFGAFTVSTQYVNVVNGGVIESSITAPVKVSGFTPFTAGLALKLVNTKDASNIGSVQWQRQPAGGGDWAPAGTGVTLKATLTESGKFNYRAVVTNKWSQAQSETNIVQLEGITAPLPNLKLVSRMSTNVAPSNVNLTLMPVAAVDAEIMGKSKLTYTWTYPDTVQGKFSGTSANMLIPQQGVYEFNVKVTDALGRSADYPATVEILLVAPDLFTMELRKAQLYEREPMSYSIRAGLRLGAKGDTVSTYTLKIDDTVVGTPSNVMPRFIAGVPAGAHTISLSYESANGSRGSKSVQVNVAQNQPPVCTMTKTEYAKYMVTKVAATCKDNDGKLKGYQWIVDDVVQKSGASSIMVNMKDRTDSANVVFKALDDSGAIGGFETTVTKPVMP